MRFACSSNMLEGSSITQKAKLLKSWGFDAISIFLDYCDYSETVFDELLHLEENTGIVPCEFAFGDEIYGHLMDKDPDIRQRAREMYLLACKVAASLGAVTEYEYEYGPQFPLPLLYPYKKMNEEEEAGFKLLTEYLVEPLKGTNGFLLLEGINRYESPYMNSLTDCADVIRKFDIPNTGLLADLFHMSIEDADMPGAIRYAGDLIRHVHLGDSNRLLPGLGNTDFRACFEALKETGFNGFMNLECAVTGDPAESLPRTLEYLHGLWD